MTPAVTLSFLLFLSVCYCDIRKKDKKTAIVQEKIQQAPHIPIDVFMDEILNIELLEQSDREEMEMYLEERYGNTK